MKTTKKILLIASVIIIVVGMFILGRNGFDYTSEYSKQILLETANQYTFCISLSTAIVLVYFAIKYNKQGLVKVLATSVLGIIGAILLTISIIAISPMQVTRIFFPIVLGSYVTSLIVLSAYFEENAKNE